MASNYRIKRIETRYFEAEQLIRTLLHELNEISDLPNKHLPCVANSNEINALANEINQLKQNVLEEKNLMAAVKTKVGIKQICGTPLGTLNIRRIWLMLL